MEGLIMTAQLLLGLSILVGLHELGHLLAAKMFGMRVEKYSIGFPPKVWGFQWGETEYSIGAIPLGGFVKISGMVDESLDTSTMGKEPEPWEFRAKPAWQRLIVMLGGIIMNVITGIVIFAGLNFQYGEVYISKDTANQNGVFAYELAREMGLENGDKVLEVNGRDFDDFTDVQSGAFLMEDNASLTIERNGDAQQIFAPEGFLAEKIARKEQAFVDPLEPFKVGEVVPGSNAEKGGLQKGDQILSVNDQPSSYFQFFSSILGDLKGDEATFTINREGEEMALNIEVSESGTIGFYAESLLEKSTKEYGFLESFPVGTAQAYKVLSDNIKGFKKIFQGEVSPGQALSGPIGIATIFGGEWIWKKFWFITGLLSLVLAFMNLLPIPALDGGHVFFLIIEMVSGKTLPLKVMEVAQKTGMVILLALMAFVIFNDIAKLLF